MMRRSLNDAPSVWIAAAIFFTGTNIVDIVYGAPGDPLHSPLTTVSLIVRIVANVWVVVAALRAYTQRGRVWAIDLPFLRYAGAFVALVLLSLIALIIASRLIVRPLIAFAALDAHAARTTALTFTILFLVGFGIVTVRLLPWIVALATGNGSVTFSVGWKGMRGGTLAAIGALVWTAPVPIAHFALTADAQSLSGNPQLWLTAIDGLVSVLQVMIGMAIAAVLYEYVIDRLPSHQ